MKNKKIYILVLIFNLFYTVCSGQEIKLKKNLLLFNGPVGSSPILKSICKINYSFTGYLIIEIDSNSVEKNNFYLCKVYWIDSLSKINFKKGIKYYPFLSFWLANFATIIPNDSLQEVGVLFSKIYTAINQSSNCNTYLYNKEDFLKTNILENANLWEKNNSILAIFKCSFRSAIIKTEINNNSKREMWNIFVPITSLEKIEPLDEKEALDNKLLNSKKKITLIE